MDGGILVTEAAVKVRQNEKWEGVIGKVEKIMT